jgi:hypothetical protein
VGLDVVVEHGALTVVAVELFFRLNVVVARSEPG